MRNISICTEEPEAVEVRNLGKRSVVFIRQDIERFTEDRDGEKQTLWRCVEYSTEVNSLNFAPTDEFVQKVISKETEEAAKEVRAKRNDLLGATDKEMIIDRIENESEETVNAWKAYRQALRDIPQQAGFPFEVEWPEM